MRPFRRRLAGWLIQQANKARRAAAEEEPEPEPEPSDPDYITAAIDGYVSQDFGTEWTTDGADADSGNVTTWPSLKGTLPDMTFLATATVDATGPLRAVNGSARGRCEQALADTVAMMILIKPGSSLQIYLSRRISTIKAFYLNGSNLVFSDDPSPGYGNFAVEDFEASGWNAIGFIFGGSGVVRAFCNGTQLTISGSKTADPLTGELRWGFGRYSTSGLSDFKIAEWLIYSGDTTDEEMIAWTAEAKARLDA